jgi:Na+/H+ antiporter NhaD/arsenite permease-like protein
MRTKESVFIFVFRHKKTKRKFVPEYKQESKIGEIKNKKEAVMTTIIIATFIIGYLAIAFEHPLKINKTASALFTGALCWGLYALQEHADPHTVIHQLSHHLSPIAEILFFLMGAMTIVELIDSHQGFKIITNRIKTKNAIKLLWITSILAFFMSATLDNLTSTIVMVTLLRKLIHDKMQRMTFVGIIVIAANAGGAWSPIGDVTTTMLWIGGQISAINIIQTLIIPSIICMVVPLLWMSFRLKGDVERATYDYKSAEKEEKVRGSLLMLLAGIGGLLFVPIFKTYTHLPPYIGMLLSLAVIWIISEILHVDKSEEEKKPYSAIHALQKIDVPSVLFFLGILLAVASLESLNVLNNLATFLQDNIGNQEMIVTAIGLLSAIVDNVPLVAGAMGMYSLEQFPMDDNLWTMLALTAGTGGSALIIGSAAGVAAMGMENIPFIWYLRKIAPLALLGYIAGILAYLLIH